MARLFKKKNCQKTINILYKHNYRSNLDLINYSAAYQISPEEKATVYCLISVDARAIKAMSLL